MGHESIAVTEGAPRAAGRGDPTEEWLGEIEGIQVSLAGAEQKLEQMRRSQTHHPDKEKVLLGLPTFEGH